MSSEGQAELQPRFRQLAGTVGVLAKILLIVTPLWVIFYLLHIPEYTGIMAYKEQFLGGFLALTLASGFLLVPPTKSASKSKLPWYDALSSLLGLISGGRCGLLS